MPTEPRETSGNTMTLLLRYVREHGGDDAVPEVLARAGVELTAAEWAIPTSWFGYETRIRLFEAATAVLDDPRTMFQVGATATSAGMHPALVPLLRAFGSPREVYRQLPRVVPKFTTTSTLTLVESSATRALLDYRLHDGYVHSRLDCDYAQGLFSAVPWVFGLPAARVEHPQCESDGYASCVYEVTWTARQHWWSLPARLRSAERGLEALQAQLRGIQLDASDLVSADDVDTVLGRILDRAASAVLAPHHLFVCTAADGAAPLVLSRGLDPALAEALAERLLLGEDLGPSAVVVDVASTRRAHGRLAALYSPGQEAMGGDRSLLEAYANHAAAALDLVSALASSRAEASRVTGLLALAHELASAGDADAVAECVARALPDVTGCGQAAVLLCDPSLGVLRAVAAAGLEPSRRALVLAAVVGVDQIPGLGGPFAERGPRFLAASTAGPEVAALLEGMGAQTVIAIPLVAGETLRGVAVVACRPLMDDDEQREILTRIEGIRDQASTALHNVRLLAELRHQSLHDPLTGLANRELFAQSLAQSLETAADGATTAVLFCDLDGFKEINDEWGHGVGDELLRQVAQRLRAVVRPPDTVGRLGGDEFAIVLLGVGSAREAVAVAQRVLDCCAEPFRVAHRELLVTASVGVGTQLGAGGNGERLLASADTAMYVAKNGGRNQIALAGDAE